MTEGQFSLVPIEVILDKRLTLEQTRVLIALFSFRNKVTDTVWPSRAKISERTGMHHRTSAPPPPRWWGSAG
ncbi:hypothetical protein GO497_02945 [Acidovorax citrulli]|nr:hypothetical protein [Paracidovorax citrulli]